MKYLFFIPLGFVFLIGCSPERPQRKAASIVTKSELACVDLLRAKLHHSQWSNGLKSFVSDLHTLSNNRKQSVLRAALEDSAKDLKLLIKYDNRDSSIGLINSIDEEIKDFDSGIYREDKIISLLQNLDQETRRAFARPNASKCVGVYPSTFKSNSKGTY